MKVTSQDHEVAAEIVFEASAYLLALRRRSDLVGPSLGQEGDRQSHHLICDRLRRAFPDDAVRSEEEDGGRIRVPRHRTWIIDPLDGTREFAEAGRNDWAIHVALAVGDEALLGV